MQQVTVWISRLVVDSSGYATVTDRDIDVKKRDAGFRNRERGEKIIHIQRTDQIRVYCKRCTEAAINEAAIKLWSRAIKPIENLFFYVTHEKVSIVGTHSDTHAAPLVCV